MTDAPSGKPAVTPPLKVLIWSPPGFGEHYSGPAMSAHRLFAKVSERHALKITAVHGSMRQIETPAIVEEMVGLTPTEPVAGRKALTLWRRARFIVEGVSWMVRHHRDFDVIFTTSPAALTLIPCLYAQSRGTPTFGRIAAAETELYDNGRLKQKLRWSERRIRLMSRFSKTVAISTQIAERLRELGMPENRILYLPNAANCERFRPSTPAEQAAARQRFGVPHEVPLITCVGSLSARKGQMVLLDALQLTRGESHLLLAGPPETEAFAKAFQLRIQELGLEKRVHLAGQVKDVEQIYQAANIFALLSIGEGMPNAMVEAMASGLPVVGTPVSGVTDLVGQDERGFIVSRDPTAVAAALNTLIEDPGLATKIGKYARNFIFENQSDLAIADRLFDNLSSNLSKF